MATQMQLKVFNIWKEIVWPPGLLERKNDNKVVSFSTLFFMFTLSWITEKERVIENKRDEFCRKKNMKIQGGCETIGTLRNHDDDGNGNVKKIIGLMSRTTTLHVHHSFLYISLPSLHNYDVKCPNFKFTW